jgi:hypothetical protein
VGVAFQSTVLYVSVLEKGPSAGFSVGVGVRVGVGERHRLFLYAGLEVGCWAGLGWVSLPVRWSGTLSACNAPVPVCPVPVSARPLCVRTQACLCVSSCSPFAFHISQWRMRMELALVPFPLQKLSLPVVAPGPWPLACPGQNGLCPQNDALH